jgi:phospholipase C
VRNQDDPTRTTRYSRRQFLGQAGAVGLAGMAVPWLAGTAASAATRPARAMRGSASTPIKHIIVCCQENHSLDHYFGSYSGLPSGYGIPPNFTQPNGHGGTVKPFHFTTLNDGGGDPNHDWDSIHSEWDQGKMDGFYTTNGKTAMGYYTSADLPYYYCSRSGSPAARATNSTIHQRSSSATAPTTRCRRCRSSPRRRPTTSTRPPTSTPA